MNRKINYLYGFNVSSYISLISDLSYLQQQTGDSWLACDAISTLKEPVLKKHLMPLVSLPEIVFLK